MTSAVGSSGTDESPTTAEAGDTHAEESDVAVRLRMVVGRLHRRLERTRAGASLTSTETTVLATTARKGPVGLTRLAEDEGMNPTMLSRVVRRLEAQGLVARRGDPGDGRAFLVEATPAGRTLHEAIRSERSDALSALLGQLEPSEQAALRAGLPVLEHLAEALKERRP